MHHACLSLNKLFFSFSSSKYRDPYKPYYIEWMQNFLVFCLNVEIKLVIQHNVVY